jgi:membrane-bound serine protease (ClpP class)
MMRRSSLVAKNLCLRGVAASALVGLALGAAEPSARPSATTQPFAQAAKKYPKGFNKAAIITINSEINDVMCKSLDRRIKRAQDQDIRLLIFELDTPGGSVSSALDICHRIKTLPPEFHTVAWVRPRAFSAGSMIALACDEILVSANSQIGDCQPIMLGPEGPEAVPEDVRAKFTSPVLTEFRDSARTHGYDQLLCQAMVQPNMEIFWVENPKTGERLFVNRAERDRRFGVEPAKAPEAQDKKGAALDKGEARNAEAEVKSTTDWRYVKHVGDFIVDKQPVVGPDELLTMTQDEAIAYGFARVKVDKEREIIDLYDISGPLERMELNWSEELVDWLTNPVVRGILMVLIVLGAYAEFHAPGVSLPGIVAIICLAIFLGAPYLTGLANIWEILLVLLGLALLALEVFVIPGFGIAGIAGVILIFVGLISTFIPDMGSPFNFPRFRGNAYMWQGLGTGLKVMASAMAASLVGAVILSRFFPKVPYVGKIVAENPVLEQVVMPDPYPHVAFLGDIGKTEGTLRPAGKARFGDTLVDVVSQSEFIGPGEPVEVIEHQGSRIVVRRVRG